MPILKISNLHHNYGDKKVLKGLSFSVSEHSITGLIGANGAGKSTTLKAVLGLIRPDEGEISVCNQRVEFNGNKTNRYVGYLPDVPQFYSFYTAREYLNFCGEIAGMDEKTTKERSEELLELVGLKEEKHRIRGFSRGMKQRLGIAQALLHQPKLLLCDEPTSALDPIGRKEILDLLLRAKEYTTILFSSHILTDIERICSEAILLSDGIAKLQGSVSTLKKQGKGGIWVVEAENTSDVNRMMQQFPNARMVERDTLELSEQHYEYHDLIKFLYDQRITVQRIERKEASLESLFMEVSSK